MLLVRTIYRDEYVTLLLADEGLLDPLFEGVRSYLLLN
jgi:hypothetical protein